MHYDSRYIMLLGVSAFDFTYSKKYLFAVITILIAAGLMVLSREYNNGLYIIIGAFFGYLLGVKDSERKSHIAALDNERNLRYELEHAKNELFKSRAEIEKLTEIRERNRIAHELHDNVGHAIAGVIFQLEAAQRIFTKDQKKTLEIITLCSKKLSETLETTHNTVYNMRADTEVGIATIQGIIDGYRYCNIEFTHNGDFSAVTTSNLRILSANIKEALTNVSKYSQAKNVEIRIDIGEKYIRLCIKDDGSGCENIHEGLGISGMRERIMAVGGTLSIDGSHGFSIISMLPVGVASDSQDEEL
jgi:signal transduction histidine kinase